MTSPIPSEPRTGHQLYHAGAIAPAEAASVAALAVATIYGAQILLGAVQVEALLASAIGDLVVLAGLVAWLRARPDGAAQIGLVAPRRRFVIAALMLGSSAWYLTLLLVEQLRVTDDASQLQGLVARDPLIPTLLALSLLPALAEEAIFRGVLARSLAPRLGGAAAIVISATAFGAYHLYPPQIVSTFTLGLVLAYLTLRAGTIVPAMIVHAMNNTIAIVLSRSEAPPIEAWIGAHPTLSLAGSAVVVAIGLTVAARGAP